MIGNVLLVMSESDEQTHFREALEGAGLKVSCAATACEAAGRVTDGGFDLLIADVLQDGRAVAEQFQEQRPSIRVLFLAACPLRAILERGALDAAAFASGRVAFLRTPLPPTVMMGKVWALLDGSAVSLAAAVGVDACAAPRPAAAPGTPAVVQPRKAARREEKQPVRVSAGAA